MRCSAYCISEALDFSKLKEYFKKKALKFTAYDPDSLYITLTNSETDKKSDVFIFKYGCIIFWGSAAADENKFIKSLSPFLIGKQKETQLDTCKFIIKKGEETQIEEEDDLIILEEDDPKIKLSLAYGLSQSVKLAVFENAVDIVINKNKSLPEMLIKTGKISLSRHKLAKKIGQLFVERNSINLHSDILDTPDFFWRQPRYEAYYNMAIEFMDKDRRIEILNKRLDVMHELYEILSAELQHAHSSRLEWIIIILILIEVIMSILRDFWH
jgi:uncharacterized Rmd1/YagE family protein